MTIKEKILTFLDAQGIKKADFFEAAGLSPSNFKGAAKQGELGGDKIAKILTLYSNLSAEWLMRDNGPMLLDKVSIKTIAETDTTEATPNIGENQVGTEYIVDRLLNKLDEANACCRSIAEENGRLKGQIDILREQLLEAREFPPAESQESNAPSRPVLQET